MSQMRRARPKRALAAGPRRKRRYDAWVLKEEAAWLGATLASLPDAAFPLLNLGSSTRAFREEQQPFIDELIFRPLRERGVSVVHADLKQDDGVDVTVDFTDASAREQLRNHVGDIRTVVSCNMLEHLTIDPEEAAEHLLDLVAVDGYLVVTVPHRYGFHADPIDNGFRPTPQQLADLFQKRAKILYAGDVVGPRLVVHHVRTKGLLRYVMRVSVLWAYKPQTWRGLVRPFWGHALVACAVVRRTH